MAKTLLVIIQMFALAMIAFGDAELWHLLDWPLTIATWVVAIGTLALGVGSIIHSGIDRVLGGASRIEALDRIQHRPSP